MTNSWQKRKLSLNDKFSKWALDLLFLRMFNNNKSHLPVAMVIPTFSQRDWVPTLKWFSPQWWGELRSKFYHFHHFHKRVSDNRSSHFHHFHIIVLEANTEVSSIISTMGLCVPTLMLFPQFPPLFWGLTLILFSPFPPKGSEADPVVVSTNFTLTNEGQ